MSSDLTIFVVNFNTTELTNMCISNIIKHVKQNFNIYVLDNSTTYKFYLYNADDRIHILDNFDNSIIDFNSIEKKYCSGNDIGNYGSLKHCYSIDWMIRNCKTKNLLIIDSDAILKRDIDFIDESFVTACEITLDFDLVYRMCPILQYFNVEKIHECNISYFDPNRMRYGLDASKILYDTGKSFYEDILNLKLPFKTIKYSDYVFHTGGFSWKQCAYGYEHYLTKLEKFKAELEFRGIV